MIVVLSRDSQMWLSSTEEKEGAEEDWSGIIRIPTSTQKKRLIVEGYFHEIRELIFVHAVENLPVHLYFSHG